MSKHGFPVATGRAPRRRVVAMVERHHAVPRSDRIYTYAIERLECGHEHWAGVRENYQPAKMRACQACKQESER